MTACRCSRARDRRERTVPTGISVDFANALQILSGDIEKHLLDNKITRVENQLGKDNPLIKFSLVDKDGDPHEIVIRIIQIPDKF